MNEEFSKPEKQEVKESLSTDQVIEVLKALPERDIEVFDEDIEHVRTMEPMDALAYLIVTLFEHDVEDPDEFIVEAGLVENIENFSQEELNKRNKPHEADDIDKA